MNNKVIAECRITPTGEIIELITDRKCINKSYWININNRTVFETNTEKEAKKLFSNHIQAILDKYLFIDGYVLEEYTDLSKT